MVRQTNLAGAIMNKNLMFGLSSKSPVFVIDGRVYYCSGTKSKEKAGFRPNSNFYEVKKGPTLKALERLSKENLNEAYQRHKQYFLSEELRHLDFKDSASGNNLAGFILKEIFPYLRKEDTHSLDEQLGTEELTINKPSNSRKDSQIQAQAEKYIQSRIKEHQQDFRVFRRSSRNKLDELLSSERRRDKTYFKGLIRTDFSIYCGDIYAINRVKEGGSLVLDGRNYSLSEIGSLSVFRDIYAKKTINELEIEALRDNLELNQEFSRLKAKVFDFERISGKTEHKEQDFGFIKSSDLIYVVYVEIPDYVLQSPVSGDLFKFSGHRLGIQIKGSREHKNIYKYPYSPDSVSGPFYNCRGGPLCMGNYSSSFLNNSRIPLGKRFARLLTDGKNVVLRGYKRGSNPYHHLDNFSERKITSAQVRRERLQITNINYNCGRH